jgi:hypothetical protein
MTLKLNSRSFFNVKLNRFEDFSWIWQWWQHLMKCSIAREFISWSDRSRIACRRRIEEWSKREWKRRNSISIKKQQFWSKVFAINDCAERFQRRNAWSYRRIIEWCSFFILIWRLLIVSKCQIFILIWKLSVVLWWEKNAESRDEQRKKNVNKHHRRQRIKIILFLSHCCIIDSEQWSFRSFFLFLRDEIDFARRLDFDFTI